VQDLVAILNSVVKRLFTQLIKSALHCVQTVASVPLFYG